MSTDTTTDEAASVPDSDGDAGDDGDGNGDSGVGPDSAGPFECRYCGQRFAREEWLALHRGLDHNGQGLTDAEREAFVAARAAENEQLRLFRLKALAALVVLYFGFVMAYAVFG